jgi:hypothetical protein
MPVTDITTFLPIDELINHIEKIFELKLCFTTTQLVANTYNQVY